MLKVSVVSPGSVGSVTLGSALDATDVGTSVARVDAKIVEFASEGSVGRGS